MSGSWLRDARANLRDCDLDRDRDGKASWFEVTDESNSRRPQSALEGFTSASSPLLSCSSEASSISDSSCKGEGEGEGQDMAIEAVIARFYAMHGASEV